MTLRRFALALALSSITGCAHLRGHLAKTTAEDSSIAAVETTSGGIDTSWVDAQHAADAQQAASAQAAWAAQQQADQAQVAWQQQMDATMAASAAAVAEFP